MSKRILIWPGNKLLSRHGSQYLKDDGFAVYPYFMIRETFAVIIADDNLFEGL